MVLLKRLHSLPFAMGLSNHISLQPAQISKPTCLPPIPQPPKMEAVCASKTLYLATRLQRVLVQKATVHSEPDNRQNVIGTLQERLQ
jgi:hypothetical protein